jgi:hypothetical protein
MAISTPAAARTGLAMGLPDSPRTFVEWNSAAIGRAGIGVGVGVGFGATSF